MSSQSAAKASQERSKRGTARVSSVTPRLEQTQRYTPLRGPRSVSPVVAAPILDGRPLTFPEFLFDPASSRFLTLLFGDDEDTAAAIMVREFRKATQFHYFGYRKRRRGFAPRNPGLLDHHKSSTKEAIKAFTHLAYRWDPDKRGPTFWKRVAALLWKAYEMFNELRSGAEEAKQREIARVEGLRAKRILGAARVQRHRAKKKAELINGCDRVSARPHSQ